MCRPSPDAHFSFVSQLVDRGSWLTFAPSIIVAQPSIGDIELPTCPSTKFAKRHGPTDHIPYYQLTFSLLKYRLFLDPLACVAGSRGSVGNLV